MGGREFHNAGQRYLPISQALPTTGCQIVCGNLTQLAGVGHMKPSSTFASRLLLLVSLVCFFRRPSLPDVLQAGVGKVDASKVANKQNTNKKRSAHGSDR